MTSIHVHIPDDVKAKLQRRATEHGHASVEAYIQTLVCEDAQSQEFDAPANVSFDSQDEFERKLLDGLNSPASQMTDADWQQLKADFAARHAGKRMP